MPTSALSCAFCKKPIAGPCFEMAGQLVCPGCHARGGPPQEPRLRCSICGGGITGEYHFFDDGQPICKVCYRDRPRCPRCGRTVARPGTCNVCRPSLHRCAACGIEIVGQEYHWTTRAGEAFCEPCAGRGPYCHFCQAPAGNAPFTYRDGRVSCTHCQALAVTDERALPRLEQQVRGFMATQLGISPRSSAQCPLKLVDSRTLARVRSGWPRFGSPELIREAGLFHHVTQTRSVMGVPVSRSTVQMTIYVEDGHSEPSTMSTVAHELTHLWQFDNFRRFDTDPRLVEGLARWVEWKLLTHLGEQALLLAFEEHDGSVYADGFHLVRQIERQHGPLILRRVVDLSV